MRYLFSWVVLVGGIILLITVGLLGIQRQAPSSAYWLVVAQNSNSLAAFNGHQTLDANFRPHYLHATSGEFIAWSPNPAYYFVRLDKSTANQPAGLYRLHVLTGERTFLVPTVNVPQSVEMELSVDEKYFLIQTRNNIPYIMTADGEHVQTLAELVAQGWEIGGARWGRDRTWIDFSVRRSIEEVDYYRIRPDGSQLQPYQPPPRSIINEERNLYLSLVDFMLEPIPVTGEFSALLESLPADNIFYVHRWLPNNWLILKKRSEENRIPPRTASILYRVRLDGTGFEAIFEDELERAVNVELWDKKGDVLYVTAEGDVNSLYEVDMQSGEVRRLIDDYADTRPGCLVDCLSVHFDRNFRWMIWQTPDNETTYKINSLEGGTPRILYQKSTPVVREISFISPDNRWFYVSYVDVQSSNTNRNCVIERVSLGDYQGDLKQAGCLIGMSPIIDLPAHLAVMLGGTLLALVLDIALMGAKPSVVVTN